MNALRMIRLVRLMRVFRVMRIAKVARHSEMLTLVFAVIRRVSQSGLVVILMVMCFMMVLSASLVYQFEADASDEQSGSGGAQDLPSAFVSIPASFWWAIA